MNRVKLIIGTCAIIALAFVIYFVLHSEYALVAQPKGLIARGQWELIKTQIRLMIIITGPAIILLLWTAYRYRASSAKAKRDLKKRGNFFKELILWVIPSIIIAVMIVILWKATHELDPYRPIKSDDDPLRIQVVAINWKWLFIYPEQGIASVNFVQFPAETPIRFELAADDSPMNSFWIPQMSGQIYAMTGMITQLHIMADDVGIYSGRAAEINGEGYADMTFVAKSSSHSDFEKWVADVKQSPLKLTEQAYNELIQPSIKHPVTLYSFVEKDLFQKIVMKYMP
jgi:cytochrome o ubiquinol oxidase subunit II